MKKRSLFFTMEVVLFMLLIPVLINVLILDYQAIHPFMNKQYSQTSYRPILKKQIRDTSTPTPSVVTKSATVPATPVFKR